MRALLRSLAYGAVLSALGTEPLQAQSATYHLHKETSGGLLLLKTADPDAGATTLLSSELKNQPPADYLIKAFNTPVGVPNIAGTIPAASTISVALWIRKTSNAGVLFPRVTINLNSASGAVLCNATGTTALTTTVARHTLTCTTTAPLAATAADRFYLWAGVNVARGAGSSRVKGDLRIEGKLNGNYDSQIVIPLPITAPVISVVAPSSGSIGTSVTINGSNFGTTQGTSEVAFNGAAGAPTNWSPTSITVPVPAGASTGPVLVTV